MKDTSSRDQPSSSTDMGISSWNVVDLEALSGSGDCGSSSCSPCRKRYQGYIDGVKSISESTMKAMDMSIAFLEQKVDGDEPGSDMTVNTQEGKYMLKGLVALEGVDHRRLDSFLRNNDADKILGNLYRITTDTGHINGGIYDPQLGKIMVTVRSSSVAKDFFSRLSKQTPAANGLKVVLDWSFGSLNLVMLVDKTAQSNVQNLKLDLKEFVTYNPGAIGFQFRPGKGKYHSLLGFLSNIKIKGLTFANVGLIGPRASSLPTNQGPSILQSFHYSGLIRAVDDSRLAGIITHCPQLIDLILSWIAWNSSETVPKVDHATGTMAKLETLYRNCISKESLPTADVYNAASYGATPLRELVDHGMPFSLSPSGLLEKAILRSSHTLEALLLYSWVVENRILDLTRFFIPSPRTQADRLPFTRLTHLHLFIDMTSASLEQMASILSRIALVHLGVTKSTGGLLSHVNLNVLKSLYIKDTRDNSLKSFYWSVFRSLTCQIDTLRLTGVSMTMRLLDFHMTFSYPN
ncbi:hypothetical protein BG015_007977 [Linnemannia schmuckeri]|uniref:Uncharacterized protein n=1 Tax=Linnemannia schmuckeri TaxID=64567 RepID=A0A9P5S8B2_9FUNG|nr:hypothetical protein BG015_007977 [Linnemannia schmuckeri]